MTVEEPQRLEVSVGSNKNNEVMKKMTHTLPKILLDFFDVK